jgi:hypothetical protein
VGGGDPQEGRRCLLRERVRPPMYTFVHPPTQNRHKLSPSPQRSSGISR